MPAPRMMRTRDIAGYLGVTPRTGLNVMHELAAAGKVLFTRDRITAGEKLKKNGKRPGKTAYIVDYRVFAEWIAAQDGRNVDMVAMEVRQWLTEARREEAEDAKRQREASGC